MDRYSKKFLLLFNFSVYDGDSIHFSTYMAIYIYFILPHYTVKYSKNIIRKTKQKKVL